VHTLVVGPGAAARNAASAARCTGTDAVTLIRSGGRACDELTPDTAHAAQDLRELAEAGVTVEPHTFATFHRHRPAERVGGRPGYRPGSSTTTGA
jgi:hypothetical protein